MDRPVGGIPGEKRVGRGVSLKPLPRHMHREFRRFCRDLTEHAFSHLSTVAFAHRLGHNEWADGQVAYWKHVIKYLSRMEYYGTANSGTGRNPR